LGLIVDFRHFIFIDFRIETSLAVLAGKLVVFGRIIRVFDIKVFAAAYRAFHFSHLPCFSWIEK
jgi:hypothetical protein